ncbi:hypothetical protein ABFY81_03410 [Acinetobacter sp. WA-87]
MVRIFCAVSMVLVIAMGVSACQDRIQEMMECMEQVIQQHLMI